MSAYLRALGYHGRDSFKRESFSYIITINLPIKLYFTNSTL